MLLLKKQKKFDLPAELKRFKKLFSLSFNPYLVVKNAESEACLAEISSLVAQGKNVDSAKALETLEKLHAIVKAALALDLPNFFTIGYYLTENPNADISAMSIPELN